MKIWRFGIIVCLCSIVSKGLSNNISSNDDLKLGKLLEIEKLFNINNGGVLSEHTIQSADNICICDKGKCVDIDGKLKCICPPKYGVVKHKDREECVPCNCGKLANCTISVTSRETLIYCKCNDGYKVVNNVCEDACTAKPCKNGGVCSLDGTTFQCTCIKPYFGGLCEHDPCTANPCKNGGQCKVNGLSFQCICKDTFTGITCDKDPCSPKPCKNGGICALNGDSFHCYCKHPFSGIFCETDLCSPNPCHNGGNCSLDGAAFQCTCMEPYLGRFCEKDLCSSNPCQNGGVCSLDGASFQCSCIGAYFGRFCENDPCSSNPCQNGGVCSHDGTTFQCSCSEPYSGRFCENNPCTANPCKNGGICSINGDSFLCNCRDPFTGKTCENGPCSPNPCKNVGMCVVNGDAFHCYCKHPFSGIMCEKDPCSYKPCRNDGVCSLNGTAFQCQCIEPHYGVTCEKERHACEVHKPCGNGGECFEKGRDYFCECTGGLTGKNCTESTWCLHTGRETCANVPCVYDPQRNISFCHCEHSLLFNVESKRCEPCYCGDHGTCQSDNGMKTCLCDENYFVKEGICFDPCNPNPCWNFGKCIAGNNGNYTCICDKHFFGRICEEPCFCGDHGTCLSEDGMKKCLCNESYIEKDGICVDPCNPNPCWNYGKCIAANNGNYTCICDKHFFGKICDEICSCGDHGTCLSEDGMKKCLCEENYIEKDGICFDPCNPNPCWNFGKCVVANNGNYTCICKKPFTGRICEEQIFTSTSTPTTFIPTTQTTSTPHSCDCGVKSFGCNLDYDGSKLCYCVPGYAQKGDTCFECDCGATGECGFEEKSGEKFCNCDEGYVEYQETCKECDCGSNGKCRFEDWTQTTAAYTTDSETSTNDVLPTQRAGRKICDCDQGYAEDQGTCMGCDCGSNGTCSFNGTEKNCDCDEGYSEYQGTCKETCSSDADCLNGGTCKRANNAFFCACPKNYFGDRCQVKSDVNKDFLYSLLGGLQQIENTLSVK